VNADPEATNIVLVHGGFVDGSGWQGVYDHLTADGYRVAVVQNPTLSLAGDVAATHQVLDALDGPVVLVGHSYGGAVITEAGNHHSVAALVYITAFAPDKGESVNTLIADPPPGAPVPPILPPRDGFLFLDRGLRAGLANQAVLVPGRHRGPDDPAAGPARHVRARRVDRHRDPGKPRDLRVQPRRCSRRHRPGRRDSHPSVLTGRRFPRREAVPSRPDRPLRPGGTPSAEREAPDTRAGQVPADGARSRDGPDQRWPQ
jgi:pimeloyl-ACP methyl ester carboxylesterase